MGRERVLVMRVLNLYAGLGGNRKLWTGVDVTAIEISEEIGAVYSSLYPDDNLIIADAHEYLLQNYQDYDYIWSSPPCQSHSMMMKAGRNRRHRYPDMNLYQEIILLENYCKVPWVIENVFPYYEPLMKPRKIGRHLFWSNYDMPVIEPPHYKQLLYKQNEGEKRQIMEWLGIYYKGNIYYDGNNCVTQVLRNCVHPIVGLKVFEARFNNEQGSLLL